MKVVLNNKIIKWPSEWPPPSAGMVLYDAGHNLEIIRVTWVLPTVVDRGPDRNPQHIIGEDTVLIDAQPTFFQVTEESLNDRLKAN